MKTFLDTDACTEMMKNGVFRYEGADVYAGKDEKAVNDHRVMFVIEKKEPSIHKNDHLKLAIKGNQYQITNAQGEMISDDMTINVSPYAAEHLAMSEADFTVLEVSKYGLKAYLTDPYRSVRMRRSTWNYLK